MTTTVSLIKILEDKTFITIEQGSWRWQNIYLDNKNICQIRKMNKEKGKTWFLFMKRAMSK